MYRRLLNRVIVGKWKIYIILIVSKKPMRFNKIKQLCHPISSNTLTRCLRQLAEDGIVTKKENTHTTYFVTPVGAKISKLLSQINDLLQ
jgi:DNA-binding HxlR family transcriptional regulator